MCNKPLFKLNVNGVERELHTGFYKHFKNKFYYVMDVAEDTETGEMKVYYKALYSDNEGRIRSYVRDVSMFLSEVDRDKYPEVKQKYRFEKVTNEEYRNYEMSKRDTEVVTIKKYNHSNI